MKTNEPHIRDSAWLWISRAGSLCAVLLGILFFLPITGLFLGRHLPIFQNGWLASLMGNWLTVIIRLHAGLLPAVPDPLFGLNVLDLVILFLVDEVIFVLAFPLLKERKLLAIIALIQPMIGILLFVFTQQVGRSAVMSSILTVCIVMLTLEREERFMEWIGIAGGVLVLLGDITVGIYPSPILATLTGLGYLLLTCWFILAAIHMFNASLRSPFIGK